MNLKEFFVIFAFFLISCHSSPGLQPQKLEVTEEYTGMNCRSIFLEGEWRFLHGIEAELKKGKKGFLLAITKISFPDNTVHCVLMTMEGFVLFDAKYDGKLTVHRSLHPFDSINFAEGLMEDIRFVFFSPKGNIKNIGTLKNGAGVCRYQLERDKIIDVILRFEDAWEIHQYESKRRIKSAYAANLGEYNIPEKLEIISFKPHPYSLKMNLIDLERLDSP